MPEGNGCLGTVMQAHGEAVSQYRCGSWSLLELPESRFGGILGSDLAAGWGNSLCRVCCIYLLTLSCLSRNHCGHHPWFSFHLAPVSSMNCEDFVDILTRTRLTPQIFCVELSICLSSNMSCEAHFIKIFISLIRGLLFPNFKLHQFFLIFFFMRGGGGKVNGRERRRMGL